MPDLSTDLVVLLHAELLLDVTQLLHQEILPLLLGDLGLHLCGLVLGFWVWRVICVCQFWGGLVGGCRRCVCGVVCITHNIQTHTSPYLLLNLLLNLAQLQLLLDEDQRLVQPLLRVQLLQHLISFLCVCLSI